MDDAALGAALRALRHRRGWRQTDLAKRAAVSDSLVALLESGAAERLSLPAVRRIAAALDVRLRWDVGFRAQELARLRDADHARLGELLVRRLEGLGWLVVPEASFNHYGERGRIDLLAYHPTTRILLVVELKTTILDVQAALGDLSVKTRVASVVARELRWRPLAVLPLLAVAETTTNRRRIADHARLFARLSLRGRSALQWLRNPAGLPDGLLILVELPKSKDAGLRRAGRQRVRLQKAESLSYEPGKAGAVASEAG